MKFSIFLVCSLLVAVVGQFVGIADAQSESSFIIDAAVLENLEAIFKKLESSDTKSLLKKYLTKEVFDKLRNTKLGLTLFNCILFDLENLDACVGIDTPADAEAYSSLNITTLN